MPLDNIEKSWQKGYDIDLLKSYEKIFESHNAYSNSPFSQIKKNNIAAALHDKTFYTEKDTSSGKTISWIQTVCKKTTDIVLYAGIAVGTKYPADVVTSALSTNAPDINILTNWKPAIFDFSKNNWVYTWVDDRNMNLFLQRRKFKKIGSKITTFGDIQYIWFKDSNQLGLFEGAGERLFPTLPKYETVSVKRVTSFSVTSNLLIANIASKLNDNDALFQNHYSNYNKGKTWGAFSLRGYTSDPQFMTKPIEMNEAWQEEYKNDVFEMQDTTSMKDFPEVYSLLRSTFGLNIDYHRIRFMKLKGGEGELGRHTDQVDPDQGLAIGRLVRFHFPIITNPDVKFTVWDLDNKPNTVNMKAGECWVLDVRKPHAAKNGGKEDRIHLVVDLIVTPDIIKMLEAK